MRPRVAVIDYGAGNLRSISRALADVGADPVVIDDPVGLAGVDAVVLPGVGAAGATMIQMNENKLVEPLQRLIAQGTPFLGVCLGMQLLFGHQEEGDTEGLSVFPGRVRSLAPGVKIPQMGWNRAHLVADGPLGAAGEYLDVYFVHSFVCVDPDPADVAAVTRYGDVFPSVVRRGAVWGTQFHPEKSGDTGLRLLRAWVELAGSRAGAAEAATA